MYVDLTKGSSTYPNRKFHRDFTTEQKSLKNNTYYNKHAPKTHYVVCFLFLLIIIIIGISIKEKTTPADMPKTIQ